MIGVFLLLRHVAPRYDLTGQSLFKGAGCEAVEDSRGEIRRGCDRECLLVKDHRDVAGVIADTERIRGLSNLSRRKCRCASGLTKRVFRAVATGGELSGRRVVIAGEQQACDGSMSQMIVTCMSV
jgi:hypothetical protein